MASRYDLVVLLCERHEKIAFAEASDELKEQLLFDVNRAYRFVYNASSLSFKTKTAAYVYDATNPDANVVPDDFLSFQDTGLVFNNVSSPPHMLQYMPWHRALQYRLGIYSTRTGPPQWYSVGGPSAQDGNLRNFLLCPMPPSSPPTLNLTIVYQVKPQPNATLSTWQEEIIPIPEAWHETVLLDVAILFRKMDKGLSLQAQNAILMEGFGQMNTQEPHGREANSLKPRFPAWGRGRRRY